jgi:CTP synthase (UTP-ammonia lyase)
MGDERFGFYVFFLKAKPKLKEWKSAIKKKPQENITIAIAGKYTALEDSYASVVEALNHAGTTINTKINIKLVRYRIHRFKQENKKTIGRS